MSDEQAYNVLVKITSLYNKTLTDEQTTFWINELKPLNELTSQKVVKNLKLNYLYSNHMPTLPQFLALYKGLNGTVYQKESEEQEYCYVCNNKGFDILREYTKTNCTTYFYDYQLHCDCCQKGKQQAINTGKYYSEPISKYYDVQKLAEKHRKIKVQQDKKNQKQKNDLNQQKEYFYKLLSMM